MVAEPLEKEQQKRLYKIQKKSEEERRNLTGPEIPPPPSFSKPSSASEKVPAFPFVALGGPHVEIVYASFNYSLPVVTSHTPPIKVPFFSLLRPLPVRVTKRFHLDVVSLTERKVPLVVPFLNLEKEVKVSVTQDFYIKTAKIRKKMTMLQVPFYHVGQFIAPTVGNHFDMEIYTVPQVLSVTSTVKKDEALQKMLKETLMKEMPSVAPALEKAGGSASSEEEMPDFFELAFGSEGGRIRGRGPKIILFKDVEGDSYINFLEETCLRIYREIEGGEPKAKKLVKLDDLNKIEIEKWMSAGGRIITIDLDRFDLSKISKDSLRERLEETYSSGLGFIIFATKNQVNFELTRRMLQEIYFECQGRLNIVFLEARKLPLGLVRLASGMLDLSEPVVRIRVGEVPSGFTFDYVMNEALFKEDSAFNKALREIMGEEGGLFKSATARAENESDLHYAIKVFVVRSLVGELRKRGRALSSREEIEKIVKTEVREGENVPDIQVEGGEAYEVETLFGEGESADKKLDETIRKYRGAKVKIVMDNFGFLLHLRDLSRVRKHYRNVEFYTLDLKNKRLVSQNEFIKELKKVFSNALP
jgi:hypothetical protein